MGDMLHPQIDTISEVLTEITKKLNEAAYMPNESAMLQNIDEEEKEAALNYHSEKLAMAFGLISTAPGTPIRVVKNLRICDDCHTATKLCLRSMGGLKMSDVTDVLEVLRRIYRRETSISP
eukprot:XP_015576526.1 pentatricopeptide repeat-containing protein At5g48910-like [Ricinus communis]